MIGNSTAVRAARTRVGLVAAGGAAALVLAVAPAAGATGAHAQQQRVTLPGTTAPRQSGVVRLGAAPASQRLSFDVTLPLRHRAALERFVTAVSTPTSPNYGHYLTPAQFAALFAPTTAQVSRVTDFLHSSGLAVDSVSANRTLIHTSGTVAHVQKAFDVAMVRYHDPRINRSYVTNDRPASVPATVGADVLGVVGLNTHFLRQHPPVPRTGAKTGPAGGYTPAELKGAYDVTPLASAGNTGSGQNVGLFELAAYKQTNITTYDNQYSLGSPTPTVTSVDGGTTTLGGAEVEVELDIEVVQALAPQAAITVFEGPNSDQGVIDTYNAMATSDTTKSNSSSWGLCEPNSSAATITSEDQIFAQMAAQGQTLFAASGDSAAYDCGTNGQLAVDNPADDPYVTGAGGTRLTVAGTSYSSEVPWDTNATEGGGGGVSTRFAKPTWQTPTPAACTKRCVPDISADADPATGYSVFTQGGWTVVGGTSAAAPLWAGFTAVYNQYAAGNGKPALGYANPTLYSHVSGQAFPGFHDIATGHTSTSTNWPALAGYDMATGIGSPDGYNLARDLVGSGGTTNDFSISVSPTNATVTPGASATATVNTALTSGTAQMIGLSASGVPSGATATLSPSGVSSGGSSTLTVSTSSSTPVGSYALTITGTGTSTSHSTTFTLSVSTTGTQLQLVKNKGFENGANFWSMSTGVLNSNAAEPPHAGTYDAWLNGYAAVHTDTVTQTLTVPAGTTSGRLKYYLHIDTAETSTTTAYDTLVVKLGSTVVGRFSNLNAATGYVVHTRAVTLPAGSTVSLSFTGTEDSSLQTSFVLDDITLTTS